MLESNSSLFDDKYKFNVPQKSTSEANKENSEKVGSAQENNGSARTQRGWASGGKDNTGVRAPDFYLLNVIVAIPNPITATVVGWSGSLSIDRHGQTFISPYGVGVGKSALFASASLTANWMLQSNKPKANETYNFLSGHGISIGGGYYGGVNWAISPTKDDTRNALSIGLYTPQLGVSCTY